MAERRASVFITGASSGLGAALARAYAARGAVLGLVARRRAALEEINTTLGGGHALYPVDVRDAEGMRAAGRDFLDRFGAPHVVIANAGISVGVLTEHAEDQPVFREIFDTNVLGAVHTFQPFVAAMRAAGRGSLAGIASVAAVRGLPGGGAYSASKAALLRYLESLRVELRGSGVAVTAVCPGFISTPLTTRNPYRMPFLMDVDDAARRVLRVIDRRRSQATVPWQMALTTLLLAHLPNLVYDAIFARRARKPRRSADARAPEDA